jgi:peptide/nickel transport system permease protein
MLAIGIIGVPIYARLTRASVLSIRERDFVIAARCTGAGGSRICSVTSCPTRSRL